MILAIVPDIASERVLNSPPNVKLIDYNTFNTLEIHPFIATNEWEYIEITVGKGIHSGYIKQILTKGNVLKAIIPKDTELDYEILSRLMEIYPLVSTELRTAYMQKKDVKEILLREGVRFEQ